MQVHVHIASTSTSCFCVVVFFLNKKGGQHYMHIYIMSIIVYPHIHTHKNGLMDQSCIRTYIFTGILVSWPARLHV